MSKIWCISLYKETNPKNGITAKTQRELQQKINYNTLLKTDSLCSSIIQEGGGT